MRTWPLERRPTELIVLAALSLVAIGSSRFPVESRVLFAGEMVAIAILVLMDVYRAIQPRYLVAALIAAPTIASLIASASGAPIALEMTALTTLGTASLAMATKSERMPAMSLVSSGFLTLFAVSISDYKYAAIIAVAWMAVCVWHLVVNHWERLDLCAVQQIRRGRGVRPVSVVAAVLICLTSGLTVYNRFGSQRITAGFMPTSGGSEWSDPTARSGVGSGDAAIAAKDHAESFGAVESDIFLESKEPSLFDMFNDTIGEPKTRTKSEKRQGLSPDHQLLESHERSAKSEKGGGSFSTDRMPTKKHLHLKDTVENAVLQWAGPTGVRLAMHRYNAFDGVDWTNTATLRNEKLAKQRINGASWFFDPAMIAAAGQPSADTTDVSLLKVLRLDANRLPTPMMTFGLHVKNIDREDFFGIEDDGTFFMPGREKVPQFTVANVASGRILEDELWQKLSAREAFIPDDRKFEQVVADWTVDCTHPLEKLNAIVERLRSEFTFDRSTEPASDDPIAAFLQAQRGGDHLFATTAVLMARQIGLNARLVTGFYVRPNAIDLAASHTNILPDDVHVWAEVMLDDGRWFEIEPTPGYRQPIYKPSTWLVTKRFAAAYWMHAIGLLIVAAIVYLTRLIWIEWSLSLAYPIVAAVWPKQQTAFAMRVIQTRARFAGCPRRTGRPQRDWLLSLTAPENSLCESVRRFCDAADRAAFAGSEYAFQDKSLSKEVLMQLKIKKLRRLKAEAYA